MRSELRGRGYPRIKSGVISSTQVNIDLYITINYNHLAATIHMQ